VNYIFTALILISFLCALITNRVDVVMNSILNASKSAVELALSLIGIMAFWLGMVRIAKDSGLMESFSKLIKKPLCLIMPELKENDDALSDVALNVSANALGLSNAATPFGIKAMEDMQRENKNKKTATNSMCIFLAMNTAGFQIVPAVVLAVVTAKGMKNPTQIVFPTLIVTSIAFVSAIIFAKILEKVWGDK